MVGFSPFCSNHFGWHHLYRCSESTQGSVVKEFETEPGRKPIDNPCMLILESFLTTVPVDVPNPANDVGYGPLNGLRLFQPSIDVVVLDRDQVRNQLMQLP